MKLLSHTKKRKEFGILPENKGGVSVLYYADRYTQEIICRVITFDLERGMVFCHPVEKILEEKGYDPYQEGGEEYKNGRVKLETEDIPQRIQKESSSDSEFTVMGIKKKRSWEIGIKNEKGKIKIVAFDSNKGKSICTLLEIEGGHFKRKRFESLLIKRGYDPIFNLRRGMIETQEERFSKMISKITFENERRKLFKKVKEFIGELESFNPKLPKMPKQMAKFSKINYFLKYKKAA